MTTAQDIFRDLSNLIRGLAIDAVEEAGHGHPGAAMGMADIATILYSRYLKFDASSPDWPDRDRIVLSNGHASIFLYSLLYLTGVPGIDLGDLKAFRRAGSITPGHPEFGHTPGVEVTTGPLGQGLGMAVGLALAERRLRDEFGPDICNHKTWTFVGDGCLMEGVGQEAASLAGHLGLGHLNVLYDSNRITIDGSTDLSCSEDTAAKFRAMGWHVREASGHSLDEIDDALGSATQVVDKPSLLIFRTTIGYGAPTKAGTSAIHGSRLGPEEAAAAKLALGLPARPFAIAPDLLAAWREVGRRGQQDHATWSVRLEQSERRNEFLRRIAGHVPETLSDDIGKAKADWISNPADVATRKASQMALEVLTGTVPELIGGSADLTGSNLTATSATGAAFTRTHSGRYINFGVREFAMGAALNGLALHGGLIPYGGTFLVFSDYMRSAIRLAALMKARSIFVMTHDSIGLGEDGPTHQPVEHLAGLRAIPGLQVFRPADVIETIEAYEIALSTRGPSLLALSRQNTEQVRRHVSSENLTSKGGYVVFEPEGARDITLLATGTEVSLALKAAARLNGSGIATAVASLPCWSLFDTQLEEYRNSVLGLAPRLAIEAASPFGWTRYVASEEDVLGMTDFGASESCESLYARFGLTVDNIVARSMKMAGASRAMFVD